MQRFAENASRRFSDPLTGYSPAQQIMHRITALSVVLLLINSFNVSHAYDGGGTSSSYDDLAVNTSVNLVADDEGYLTKVTPWEGQAQYLNRGDQWVTHEVQSGDTLSVIAYRYGLSMSSIQWANSNISNLNYLKVGQELRIPPADGYEVAVKSGDTLDTLIEKYYEGDDSEADKAQTIALNELAEDGTVSEGATLFIVGGEKPYEPTYVASGTRDTGTTTYTDNTRVLPSDASVATVNYGDWIKPTSGVITTWYSWGHYAIDIADRSKPYVVASRGGTVVEAQSDNGWHGGYGNVIKIDHGETELGNCTSLYAHNSTVYVSAGDYVEAGQIISNQGNTGRVYGATGIHLHFELICDGVKLNPGFVFGY